MATTHPEPIDILTGIATNRSIHRFLPDAIPDEDLNEILYAATRGPSGNNAQPSRFLVVRSGPKSERAKALLGDSFRKAWAAKSNAEGWEKGSGADPNIENIVVALEELSASAKELRGLVGDVNELIGSPELTERIDEVDSRAQDAIDYTTMRMGDLIGVAARWGIALILVFFGALFGYKLVLSRARGTPA